MFIGNKKGQEGFSTTGLLAIVLGVIALVVLAMFIYNIYSKPNDLAKLLPNEFSQALTYCQNSPFSDPNQYCLDYKEFEVKSGVKTIKKYYNCYDIFLQAGDSDSADRMVCDKEASGRSYCLILDNSGKLVTGVPVYISDQECMATSE